MKSKKLLIASVLVGVSALAMGTATACTWPTWLGGKAPTHKVVISIDGVDTEVKLNKGVIAEKPEDPVKEGYNFVGWFLDEACTKEYKFDKALNKNSTIYAAFVEKEYVITYIVDGVAQPVTFKWSETPSIAKPKKDGYVFKSWYLDEALTQEYLFTQPVREELTVYAKFVESYKIEYVVSPNGSETEDKEIVETENETAPIKPADPVVEGYDFAGWFLDKDFKTAYNFDTVLTAGTAIYAKLVEKEYTITYMVGGTDVVLDTVSTKYWSVPAQPETPQYEGMYFFGWYLDEEYKNSCDFSESFKVDTIVYAQFLDSKPIYTAEELIAIAEYPAGNYQLQNDITLANDTWTPIEIFSGKFDGNGYKIYDFTMTKTSSISGFVMTNKGTIKNLTLENFSYTATYTGTSKFGVLAGVNEGTIEDCTLINFNVDEGYGITYKNNRDGAGADSYYGGLVGQNTATGIVKNCSTKINMVLEEKWTATNGSYSSSATYSTQSRFGGAIGRNQGAISNIASDVTLISTHTVAGASGRYGDEQDYGYLYFRFGGLVSLNEGTTEKSTAKIDINSSISTGTRGYMYGYVGGLVELNETQGKIYESVSVGTINLTGSATDLQLGGFARYNYHDIRNSYANTTIVTDISSGGRIGGFVAENNSNQNSDGIYCCYATGNIDTGANFTGYVGGFIGYSNTNAQSKNCFTVVDITTTQATLGAFVGDTASANSSFVGCYYASDATIIKNGEAYESPVFTGLKVATEADLYTENILTKKLYWNYKETTWRIDGVHAPTLLWEAEPDYSVEEA